MKSVVYKWDKQNLPIEAAEIARVKSLINAEHSHANIVQAYRNTLPSEGDRPGVRVEFFDTVSTDVIDADLFHAGYVGMLSLQYIQKINNAGGGLLRVRADYESEYRALFETGLGLVNKFWPEATRSEVES